MNTDQILTKSQKKKLKRAAKRKASSSPDIDSHYLYGQGAQSGTEVYCNTGLHNSGEYVHTVMMNNGASPVLPMGQPMGQYSVFTQGTPSQGIASPPSWLLPMMEDIKALKSIIPKIETIEKTVSTMNIKISEIETKFKDLEIKVNGIEESIKFKDKEFESIKKDFKGHQESLQKMQKLTHEMKKCTDDFDVYNERVTDRLLDLEARSMKDNLIFYGLSEPPPPKHGEDPVPDDCDKLVRGLLKDTLDMDPTLIEFNRIHRLGGNKRKSPRPIIVNFRRFADRENIRRKSYDDTYKAKLKEAKQGVGVQMPQEYRDARRVLTDEIPYGQKSSARIVGNKLFINNKLTKKYHDGKVFTYDD